VAVDRAAEAEIINDPPFFEVITIFGQPLLAVAFEQDALSATSTVTFTRPAFGGVEGNDTPRREACIMARVFGFSATF
jgi:hypothetical protein